MTDDKREKGTKPLPALEGGGGESGEDASSVTADWFGKDVVEAVDQAADARQGLEDELAHLLGKPPGPEPGSPPVADDDVAFAQTQEMGVLDDTAPTLPTAEDLGLSTELKPNAPPPAEPALAPASMPSRGGRVVVESSDQVVVFSEEQRRQLEHAIQRRETNPQEAFVPTDTDPVGRKSPPRRRGRGVLVLLLIVAGLAVGAAAAWFYLS